MRKKQKHRFILKETLKTASYNCNSKILIHEHKIFNRFKEQRVRRRGKEKKKLLVGLLGDLCKQKKKVEGENFQR